MSVRTAFNPGNGSRIPEHALMHCRAVLSDGTELYHAMRDGCPHVDARMIYNCDMMPYLLWRTTVMCKQLRDVRSGLVVLHVFGDRVVLNHPHGHDYGEDRTTISSCKDSSSSPQLTDDVLRYIRRGEDLTYVAAIDVLGAYISDECRRDSFPQYR